jgi:trehalose 6-phosphate phosphatase
VEAALERLRAEPSRAAILTDVDGTLAPIVERPEDAAVDPRAVPLLERLADRYALVGCISGRTTEEAKRLVGIEGLGYAGNHGLEVLLPGDDGPHPNPALRGHESDAVRHLVGLDMAAVRAAGLRLEDKGPIQALHWRGADREDLAEAMAHDIAGEAAAAGLKPHWGHKVLELRPKVEVGKDAAVAALLAARTGGAPSGEGVNAAVYAGDDRTDLDAFRRLREMRDEGALETAICIGIASHEAPGELARESDLTVDGPAGWLDVLEDLAS